MVSKLEQTDSDRLERTGEAKNSIRGSFLATLHMVAIGLKSGLYPVFEYKLNSDNIMRAGVRFGESYYSPASLFPSMLRLALAIFAFGRVILWRLFW